MARTAAKVRASKASTIVAAKAAAKSVKIASGVAAKSVLSAKNAGAVAKKHRFRRTTLAARSIRRAQRDNHGLNIWIDPCIRALRYFLRELGEGDRRIANNAKRPIVEILQTRVLGRMIDASRLVKFRKAKTLTVRDLQFGAGYLKGSNFAHVTIANSAPEAAVGEAF